MRYLFAVATLAAVASADIISGQPYPAPAGFEEWISPIIQPSPQVAGSGSWAAAVKKARAFVAGLSNAEKVNITTGIGINGRCVGNTGRITRLNFDGFCMQDSPLGVRFADFVSAFPAGINVAATFDQSLFQARGAAMGAEFHGKGVNVALGPMTNMGRVAAGGRNWEGFGAEPYLSGIATAQTIQGIQSTGVIACVKHYIANEQEHMRGGGQAPAYSSNLDDRTMHEIYNWPFADAVHAGVGSIMCSYNRINQTFACENSKMLTGIAKEELDFQGFIVSDWAALVTGINSALAGTDMDMPGFFRYGSGHDDVPDPSTSLNSFWGANLIIAIANGTLPQSRLDDMVTRIFTAFYQMGQDKNYPKVNFASGTTATLQNGVVVNEHVNVQGDHKTLIREIGAASSVLLKNVDNALPLNAKDFKRFGVFGQDATISPDGANQCGDGTSDHGCDEGTLAMGWGSGTTTFPYLIDPLSAIRDFVIANHPGAIVESVTSQNNINGISATAARSDVCLVFGNADSGEGYLSPDGNAGDRNNLTLWQNGENVILATANNCANTIVVLHNVGPVIVESWIDHPNVMAVIAAGLPGQESGNAIVDVLFGAVNPSGRLPYTIARNRSDYPADVNYSTTTNDEQITYTEGLNIDYRHFDAAGIEPRFEFGFGLSYTSFSYSGLSIKTSSGKREFFDIEGRAINATQHAPAASSSSSSSSPSAAPTSSASIITTHPNPSSATSPTTSAAPSPSTTATTTATTTASTTTAPAAPTSTFVPPPDLAPGGSAALWTTAVTATFHVKNTGGVDGHEVSQLYLGFPTGSGEPPRVLRGFARTMISKGKSATVTLNLLKRDISIWDTVSQAWIVPAGEFTVFVGASSRDLRLKGTFSITKLPVGKVSTPPGSN